MTPCKKSGRDALWDTSARDARIQMPTPADFADALCIARTDHERRALALSIVDTYRPYIENLLTVYYGESIRMRTVESVRISSGVRAVGACRYHTLRPDLCRLSFSRHLFFPGNENALVSIIAHEMLHACLPMQEGHGYEFCLFAKALNERLGLCVTVHSEEDALAPDAVRYRYKVTCDACGNTAYYLRAGKVVQHANRYRCAKCGAGRLRVETLP